ncbi:MAG: TlpA disulfide reductase family protein [Bacteroidota bacterium]|jgi:thiol-disulfide isomerase/thioredoxin
MKQLLLFSLAFLLLSCGKKETKESASTTTQQNYKNNVSVLIALTGKNDQGTPNFTWKDSSGKVVSFSEFSKGKPVLVNFWATWCGPCVREIPDLVALNQEYASKGAVILGISADRDADALDLVSGFASEKQMQYQIVIDDGTLEEAFGGLRGYPTTFYVDKEGKIVKKLVGLQSKETFSKELDALL